MTTLEPNSVGSRIYGAVLGQAIGDALGHPNEFIIPGKRQAILDLPEKNLFTDDTQLFCAIGEALISHPPHVDEEAFMNAMCENFSQWRVTPLGGSHRAPGNACLEGARRYGKACPSETSGAYTWRTSGDRAAKGNGSAMRAGVIGAMYYKFPEYAFKLGAMTSVPTHNNLESLLGSALIAYLTAIAVNGSVSWPTSFGDGLQLCYDFEFTMPNDLIPDPPKHKDLLLECPQYGIFGTDLERPNPWYAIGHWGASFAFATDHDKLQIPTFRKWNGDDNAVVPAVAASIFFNTRFADFRRVALASVNYSGDCDTVGAISCCLAGARFGQDAISETWRKNIEMSEYLHDLASRLCVASQGIEMKKEESFDVELKETVAE
jgi:ADP-ribosylglycohydrolase